jgi:hypothetical protein
MCRYLAHFMGCPVDMLHLERGDDDHDNDALKDKPFLCQNGTKKVLSHRGKPF